MAVLEGSCLHIFQKSCKLSVNWFLNPEISRARKKVPSQEFGTDELNCCCSLLQSWLWRCLMMVYFSKQGFRSTAGESRLYWIPGLLAMSFCKCGFWEEGLLGTVEHLRTCSRGDTMTQISGPQLWFVTTMETLLMTGSPELNELNHGRTSGDLLVYRWWQWSITKRLKYQSSELLHSNYYPWKKC